MQSRSRYSAAQPEPSDPNSASEARSGTSPTTALRRAARASLAWGSSMADCLSAISASVFEAHLS